MKSLLSSLASSLSMTSFFPIGNPSTLTLWSFPSIMTVILKVSTIVVLSTLCFSIFGYGLIHLIDQSIIPVPDTMNPYIYKVFMACISWIALMSMNHIMIL